MDPSSVSELRTNSLISSRRKRLLHKLLQLRLVTVWNTTLVKSTTLNQQKGEMLVMSQRFNGKRISLHGFKIWTVSICVDILWHSDMCRSLQVLPTFSTNFVSLLCSSTTWKEETCETSFWRAMYKSPLMYYSIKWSKRLCLVRDFIQELFKLCTSGQISSN